MSLQLPQTSSQNSTALPSEEEQVADLKTPDIAASLADLRSWIQENLHLLRSSWIQFPARKEEEDSQMSIENIRSRVQSPGGIAILNTEEEHLLTSHLKTAESGFDLKYCIGPEEFRRRYQESLGFLHRIIEEKPFHHHYLNMLLKLVSERLFLMNAPEEVIAYFTKDRRLLVVWSSWDLETLYKKMRALS